MRLGLYIPPFDELADPALVARLCAEARRVLDHGRGARRPQSARKCSKRRSGSSKRLGPGSPSTIVAEHYAIDAMRFLPRPVQRPGVPIWVAGFYGKSKPLRRAIRYQGFVPVGIEHPDQLAEISAEPRRLGRKTRGGAAEPFDIAVELDPGSDPAPYAAAGATWGLVACPWNPVSVDQVRGVIREGPGANVQASFKLARVSLMPDYPRQTEPYDDTRSASPSVLGPLREALDAAPGRRLVDIGGGMGTRDATSIAVQGTETTPV